MGFDRLEFKKYLLEDAAIKISTYFGDPRISQSCPKDAIDWINLFFSGKYKKWTPLEEKSLTLEQIKFVNQELNDFI